MARLSPEERAYLRHRESVGGGDTAKEAIRRIRKRSGKEIPAEVAEDIGYETTRLGAGYAEARNRNVGVEPGAGAPKRKGQ